MMPEWRRGKGTMDEDYQIVYVDKPDDAIWTAIGGGIDAFNKQQAGDDHARACAPSSMAPMTESPAA